MKRFFRRVWAFIKRNTYAIAVCVCVILVLTLVSVTALTFINNGTQEEQFVPDIPAGDNDDDIPSIPSGADDVVIFTSPVVGGEVSKHYAEDHLLEDKTSGSWITHQGIDFAAAAGTKVVAVYDGVVESVEQSMMDGLVIKIRHSNDLVSVYKCLSDEALVSEGDEVVKGQEIGTISTNLTEKGDGAHLHYELWEGDKLIDPTPYFSEGDK